MRAGQQTLCVCVYHLVRPVAGRLPRELGDGKCDLQLLWQCGNMNKCPSRCVPEIH